MDVNKNCITRKVDAVGRISIAPKFLDSLNLEIGDSVLLYIDDNGSIVLKKDNHLCVFCGSDNVIVDAEDAEICINCKKNYENVNRIVINRYKKQIIPNGRRLVIPFKIRRQLKIATGDSIKISPFEDHLLLDIME